MKYGIINLNGLMLIHKFSQLSTFRSAMFLTFWYMFQDFPYGNLQSFEYSFGNLKYIICFVAAKKKRLILSFLPQVQAVLLLLGGREVPLGMPAVPLTTQNDNRVFVLI